jgi:hypothetical protein
LRITADALFKIAQVQLGLARGGSRPIKTL